MKNYLLTVNENGTSTLRCLQTEMPTDFWAIAELQSIAKVKQIKLEEALDMISRDCFDIEKDQHEKAEMPAFFEQINGFN